VHGVDWSGEVLEQQSRAATEARAELHVSRALWRKEHTENHGGEPSPRQRRDRATQFSRCAPSALPKRDKKTRSAGACRV